MLDERVPDLKQSAGEREAGFSELLLGGQPFAVEPEVPLQVTPTGLSLLGVQEVVRPPPVRGHDPVKIVAEQRLEPVAVAILNDPEDRRLRSHSSPHRAVISGKEPAGLIDVYRARAQHLARETLVRAGEQP